MSFIAALFQAVLAVLQIFGFFRPKQDPTQAVVAVANQEAAISARTADQTAQTTQKELANAQAQTDATVAAVHSADGVRGVSDAIADVNSAIDRANTAGGV